MQSQVCTDEETASAISMVLAMVAVGTEADWVDVATDEAWRRTALCVVEIGEAAKVNAVR